MDKNLANSKEKAIVLKIATCSVRVIKKKKKRTGVGEMAVEKDKGQ